MPSPTDFNVSPYYDDFNESKKFHRILFRPAFAVQARELTQSQSQIQNQIERVSDHLFDKGAMVIPGEVGYDLDYYSIKLTSKSASSLSDYNGKVFKGATSGVIAKVVNFVVTDGTDPDTLFVKYIASGTNFTDEKFSAGETIAEYDETTAGLVPSGITAVVNTCHTGSAAEIKEGVYYINGFHVQVSEQTLILDKYTNTPSYRVGLTVTESFVTPGDDTTLNDNAQGVSNTNAPGSHRFKILLTLAKKTLTSTEDSNFYELLRLSNGSLQNKVHTTEYAVLEESLARRTFDESGDYVVRPFDIDVREHSKNNTRGIYTDQTLGGIGDTTKLAVGISPGKAYVKGFEIEKISTTFVDVDKARDFDTQNAFPTRFDVGNFVNVTNTFGTPDVGFISDTSEAFKKVDLLDTANATPGTLQSATNSTVPEIGRAKTKGFEYVSGTESNDIYGSSAVYKQYLFDIVMFTHLNILTAQSFTTGETVTGGTSGATATVQSISTTESASITGATKANPVVVTANNKFKEGQQITIASVGGMTQINSTFTVRNPSATQFELYSTDGTTSTNGTAFGTYTSGGTAAHGVVVVTNVQGTFVAGETITGGTSSNTAVIQADAVGFKGVTSFDLPQVKQISNTHTGTTFTSAKYTADTTLDATNGENVVLTGSMSIANSGTAVTGFNTKFTEELKIGDSISFTTDGGTSLTRLVEAIISNTSMTLSAAVGGSDVSTKTIATRRRAKLQSPEKNISIFKLPYETIKTLKTTSNSGLSDTSYKLRRTFSDTLSSDGDMTINAGANEVFVGAAGNPGNVDYTVSILATGSGGTGSIGDILNVTGTNHEGDNIFTLPLTTQAKFDFGANFAGHTVKVVATLSKSSASSKSKTLTTVTNYDVETAAAVNNPGGISLAEADIESITSIKMVEPGTGFVTYSATNEVDITDRYELDNGQRDNFYDIGRIKLKDGQLAPTGSIRVNFKYYAHGTGDFFDVDSYTGIDYENISDYTSQASGEIFELRDCLDFRPRVMDASTINSGNVDRKYQSAATSIGSGASVVDVVKFNDDITSDFEYYLGRVDKIYLDKDGTFKVLKGASSLTPRIPGDLDSGMHLYTLFLSPYTIDTADVGIEHVDNKRYTMRDIGRLENRIETAEYYTQLSLLETAAQNLQIQDANGLDRFKNGFIVDNFTGHSVGDVRNNDYKVSIDYAKGELRPTFHEDVIQLVEKDDDATDITDLDRTASNYQKTGDLITLPYTESTLINQPYASKAINVNPFGVFTWIGAIELTPPGDEWKETERLPELVINNPNGSWDNLVKNSGNAGQLKEFPMSTVWNSWQDTWTGRPTVTERRRLGTYSVKRAGHGFRRVARDRVTTAQQVSQTRTGIRAVAIPETVRQSMGDKIVSIAFVPFIRSKTITFNATRLKPNTRVYPYFDNEVITAYVTPSGGALGGNLVTDGNGAVSGTFVIPDPKVDTNPRWRTGDRLFRLTSSASNSQTAADVETAANAEYVAKGTIETVRETIVSSRQARVEMRTVTGSQTITRTSTRTEERTVGYHDPLAQTFMIDDTGGVFLTSIDLYFSSKDVNIPVTVQIRDTVNGYPGQKILPFSEVSLNPSAVNTSTDGSTATKFTFPSPVYIQENVEYAVVVMANTQDYNMYVARLGEKALDSSRTISQQPYNGVLFKSQNGVTWTADQNEDMKFLLRRAEFSNVTGSVTLTNDTLPSRTLKNNPLRTTNGSAVVRVFHPNHGMHGTNNNVTISGCPTTGINGLDHTEINTTHTSISNVTLDSYDITVSTAASSTGDVGSNAVVATQNRLYDVLNLSGIQTMVLPGTTLNHFLRPTTGRSIDGSETEFQLTSLTNKIGVVGNDNIAFTAPQLVASSINETNEMGSTTAVPVKSLHVIMELSTSNTKISPVIDLQRISAFAIQNRLNSPDSGDPDFVDDFASSGTSTAAVYLTKPIKLENSSTALEVRTTANIRATSDVLIFFRALGTDDDRQIDELSFSAFNTTGTSDVAVTPADDDATFKEYKYSASGINEFTTFQLKIVLKGTNSAYPPVLKDMRGVALAV